ncbi:MmpS family transport accessory protein [Streptomyces sp. NPDC059909]|uniref:MmpS family transport accessory protein n=1 Tax=Streptomyces sp. NPDC059909 TaxID=3346998 RepID=UPI00365565E6
MNRTTRTTRAVRTTRAAAAAAGLAFGLVGCDAAVDQVDKAMNETYQVTYEVTGKNVDSIEYNAGAGTATEPKLESVQKPTLPWKRTVTLKGIAAPTVVPIAVDPVGAEVVCTITYQGKVIKEESGAGIAAATGCVAISPITG